MLEKLVEKAKACAKAAVEASKGQYGSPLKPEEAALKKLAITEYHRGICDSLFQISDMVLGKDDAEQVRTAYYDARDAAKQ